ncbi:MAG: gluconolactonase [Sphingomonas sp.]|jgi:DNA-binding beta-propeller fold protein YncE|uniref:YncE family protein n=1 Tax=Sphingomonas sp. TaxID=28214 RepID=UPI001AC7BD8D|nr:gluconolactonase [Sphingomonas sp.]MBN8815928.1 gluconolactonase [Sphingomonas sp.]
MRAAIFAVLAAGIAGLASAATPVPHYKVVDTIAGPDGSWDYASVDPQTGRLFVARGDGVTMFNLKEGITTSWKGVARAHAVVPLRDGRILVTSGNDATVRWFDVKSGQQTGSVAVGRKPDAAIADMIHHRVLVMNSADGTVSVVDADAMRVTRTIKLKPGLEYAALDGTTLFVNDEDSNEIEVTDLAANRPIAPIALNGCEGPTGIAYDAQHDTLIAACANGKAAIVDAKSRRLVKLIDIGRGPDAVIMDYRRRLAFIPCGRDGVLEILSLDAPGGVARVGRVTTEVGARTGALDPATGTIYLPTARFSAPASPAARPSAVPGSFHVLVVRPAD